ncbi:hypothetical protein BpHYR1_027166 [Brachionus plicatilis]|uniref:Uncharacterized protein n=1 Tax=Brachionus plicatilis TaxID=10195 RepID=A0A3M7QFR9_BRAPC|nr:hypothetical protein BpHYR1_027166 [Brachionus plicatilis]
MNFQKNVLFNGEMSVSDSLKNFELIFGFIFAHNCNNQQAGAPIEVDGLTLRFLKASSFDFFVFSVNLLQFSYQRLVFRLINEPLWQCIFTTIICYSSNSKNDLKYGPMDKKMKC